MKTRPLKSRPSKLPKNKSSKRDRSIEMLKLKLKFWILIVDLALAGISIVMRIETPVVWTFLYGIGGWVALTTNPRGIIR